MIKHEWLIEQSILTLLFLTGIAHTQLAVAATLEVGPGKAFARIEEANAKAQPGDVILVWPQEGGRPYEQTAVFVRQKDLTFRAAPQPGGGRVKISGKGFDYSGSGATPRAVFQFNRGTDHCTLEGIELSDAHNDSHNGAGVRINQANHVTVRNCSIHDNDMGIMSNGDGSANSAADQRIEQCEIHHNGNAANPGYNHNLYLGGTSVTLSFCEVHHSLTGHNVKSRAHHTRVQYCYIHDSANREFDLVDAAETTRPQSDAVLMGNIIVKDPKCTGNRTVIHFGQDGGKEHSGVVRLEFNTIVNPFISPVVELSAPGASAHFFGNFICDGGQRQNGQVVIAARNGAKLAFVGGIHNWFSGSYGSVADIGLDHPTNVVRRVDGPTFIDPGKHNYRLVSDVARAAAVPLSAERLVVPPVPGMPQADDEPPLKWQYRHPASKEARPVEKNLTLGAYAR